MACRSEPHKRCFGLETTFRKIDLQFRGQIEPTLVRYCVYDTFAIGRRICMAATHYC